MKTACKGQGKTIMYISRVVLKLCFSIKMKRFSLRGACGRCISKCLKEHSAVVVKKEFWLRKAFNFFKKIY